MSDYTFFAAKPVEKYHKIDMWLLISMLLLWGLGIFTIVVTSQNGSQHITRNPMKYVNRQLVSSAFGFVFFFILMILDMKFIKKLVPIIVVVSLILCILTFIPGISSEINGARRWLKLGKFTFQPSELVKFSIVLFIANYFEKQTELSEDEQTVLPCVIGLVISVFLIILQKDLSTAVFILAVGILLFFVTGAKLKWIWPFMLIAIPGLILMVSLESYRLERIIGFIRPDEFASNVNYQSINAKKAITAGGIWGNGIGTGLQKIRNIPEIQADFIFAGWSEAMGFVGVLAYFGLLVFFAVRGYMTAVKNPSKFVSVAVFGCVTVIFVQSLVNTMVVCGLLPTTGIPLPFFSLGGSSIMVTLAMGGFIVNASRCEDLDERKLNSDENEIGSLSIL